jgi:hypothetical protein
MKTMAVGVVIAVTVGGPAACFVGDAASGLPCNADRDCGLDDRCIDGYCGGPPLTTTVDPTTGTTDSGTTEPATTTGELLCDGQPGAVCEPEMPGIPDAECDGDCTFPQCGDGTHNPHAVNDGVVPPSGVEECDEGIDGVPVDTPDCDDDCTLPTCGDGHSNAAAGEGCDDVNADNLDGCVAGCQVPLFTERFDAQVWTSEPYDLSRYEGTIWADATDTVVSGWVWQDGRWNSGAIPYRALSPPELTYLYNYAGVTHLVSPPFDLPAVDDLPPGYAMQLRFWHRLTVEGGCEMQAGTTGDGGVIQLRAGGESSKLVPAGGYMALDTETCEAGPIGKEGYRLPNPQLSERDGLALTGPEQEGLVTVDLTAHLGKPQVQLVFEFGTDCFHCTTPAFTPSRWEIDDVVVAAFPIE